MKILITLSTDQNEALEVLMNEDLQTNRSAYFAYLIAQETKRRREDANPATMKRPQGRPRKDGTPAGSTPGEDFPDENAPRTLILPEELRPYVLQKDRAKLVNEYDITMLEAKKEAHEATS